ncbi:hypothetical protein [Psittacid alphaherpesvirus 5]|uniref:Uncharacterized protein n=1 Tax=Psittacid alphaherpesvirus 5 TaxID=2972693 RepID=A0A5P9JR83_9ALPH|nr:hypothetical protein QKU09_gp75 [Psittacid alphaherpesvirus 5]QFU14619.1 hypothetical protein [Psittacid alphaherpesvirus 5]UOO01090.1 hypothetical protein [Psittacid alphaherpesvirus 5]
MRAIGLLFLFVLGTSTAPENDRVIMNEHVTCLHYFIGTERIFFVPRTDYKTVELWTADIMTPDFVVTRIYVRNGTKENKIYSEVISEFPHHGRLSVPATTMYNNTLFRCRMGEKNRTYNLFAFMTTIHGGSNAPHRPCSHRVWYAVREMMNKTSVDNGPLIGIARHEFSTLKNIDDIQKCFIKSVNSSVNPVTIKDYLPINSTNSISVTMRYEHGLDRTVLYNNTFGHTITRHELLEDIRIRFCNSTHFELVVTLDPQVVDPRLIRTYVAIRLTRLSDLVLLNSYTLIQHTWVTTRRWNCSFREHMFAVGSGPRPSDVSDYFYSPDKPTTQPITQTRWVTTATLPRTEGTIRSKRRKLQLVRLNTQFELFSLDES